MGPEVPVIGLYTFSVDPEYGSRSHIFFLNAAVVPGVLGRIGDLDDVHVGLNLAAFRDQDPAFLIDPPLPVPDDAPLICQGEGASISEWTGPFGD